MEQRSVARAVEVAEGLADKGNRESSPASRVFRSHLQDRHEHLIGDVGELEGQQGRGSGAGAAAARAEVEFFGKRAATSAPASAIDVVAFDASARGELLLFAC